MFNKISIYIGNNLKKNEYIVNKQLLENKLFIKLLGQLVNYLQYCEHWYIPYYLNSYVKN
jgi:hypothetical protein